MMNNELILKLEKLVHELGSFTEQNEISSKNWLAEFGKWLENNNSIVDKIEHPTTGHEDTLIGMYIVTLMTLARNMFNKLINNIPFSTIMDYQFLFILDKHGKQTKSELISLNCMEMSSGIEVIKRLLKSEWISELENPEDRRSKYVIISNSGKNILDEYQTKVDQVYGSFSTGLTPSQKDAALSSLNVIIKQISSKF